MKNYKTLLLALLISSISHWASGQQYNLGPAAYESNTIGLRAGIPMFKDNEDVGALSGIYSFFALLNLGNDWSLYGEVPLILTKFDDGDISETDNGFGNIFVEVRRSINQNNTSHFSLGAYLPTVGEDNFLRQGMGFLSNPFRAGQSISAFTLSPNYSYNNPQEKNTIFGLDIGPDVMFPTAEDSDTEVWAHFGIKAGHKFNKLQLWSELSGQFWFTESDLETSERLFSQLGLTARLKLGKVNPSLFYGIPLNKEIREGQSGLLGFKVEVGIQRL